MADEAKVVCLTTERLRGTAPVAWFTLRIHTDGETWLRDWETMRETEAGPQPTPAEIARWLRYVADTYDGARKHGKRHRVRPRRG